MVNNKSITSVLLVAPRRISGLCMLRKIQVKNSTIECLGRRVLMLNCRPTVKWLYTVEIEFEVEVK